MIAVSNTTPLRYLIAIQHEHLLKSLFERVLIPTGVHRELTDAKTPAQVREHVLATPEWIEIRTLGEALATSFPYALHQGEREAILLAERLHADVLLIDEQFGRAVAIERGLPISGTLGVLERADSVGLVQDFAGTLQRLKESGFFITEQLMQRLLERHRARRGGR